MSLSASKVTDNTHEMSFHELFSQTTQITIPLFQREYVWTEKQLKRMFEEIDIINNGEDANRFLGAVIAVRRNANPAEPQPYEIVDGQQRLSTLFLIVMAAAAVAAKNKDSDYAKGLINTNIIIEWWQNGVNTKLYPSFADRNQFSEAFKLLINSGDLSAWLGAKVKLPESTGAKTGKYINQFNKIKSILQKRVNDYGIDHLKSIVSIAQTKLTFVFILLKDPSTATTVFEGLNDPGMPIGIGDLVRNEVFSKISHDPNLAQSIHRDLWLPFKNKLGEHFDKYFFPYALIHDQNLNTSDLFRGLRKIWGDTSKPDLIIEKLEIFTKAYLALCNGSYPSGYSKGVKEAMDKLVFSRCPTSVYPFVMRLLNEYTIGNVSEKDTIDCILVIESFMIRRAIAGLEPTGLLGIFRSAWDAVNGKPSAKSLSEIINKRNTVEWPDDSRIKDSILRRNMYSTHLRQYLLKEYELSLGSDVPKNEFWIEHIMPQTLNDEWRKVITDRDHDDLKHTWGNLIPLTQEMNQSISQSSYIIKKKEFEKNSVFASARNLSKEYSDWTKKEILERSEKIADWAVIRWKK
ncbi:MAG: DUF262 domain-containing protein [Bacteroidetes bacterium]|nr:DUF262 domain-containing protein [Bacteroidota bacterium]